MAKEADGEELVPGVNGLGWRLRVAALPDELGDEPLWSEPTPWQMPWRPPRPGQPWLRELPTYSRQGRSGVRRRTCRLAWNVEEGIEASTGAEFTSSWGPEEKVGPGWSFEVEVQQGE